MKNILYPLSVKTNALLYIFLFATLFQGIPSMQAQTTEGTEFWVTFGSNHNNPHNTIALQIRIVSQDLPTSGNIYFTNLGTSISFNMNPREVYTYDLNSTQKQSVYNLQQGISNRSIHITSNNPVTAYAVNLIEASTDATNILPITALGNNYYQISYSPREDQLLSDAYAVIATENDTQVFHNGGIPIILNAGQVYYKTAYLTDMTGAHITTDKPVAFFALNQGTKIPNIVSYSGDHLMQQLAPVNTWGKNFFVPVSDLTTPTYSNTKNRVRIVASQNNTVITTPAGATLITNTGGQANYTLQAGQFIELEVTLLNNGCFIQADKPVGVCIYLTSRGYNNNSFSDPSQAWLPSIEQTVSDALVAPFIARGSSVLERHYALLFTPIATKNNTRVSIGGGTATPLSGGQWRDHATAGFSFYSMPLTHQTASYNFTNNEGLIVMGYGYGPWEAYYYLAYSAMRNLEATFYANDIYYLDMPNHTFCQETIIFRAEIEGMGTDAGSLKWYINNFEETEAQDKLIWSKYFADGDYDIKMMVRFLSGDSVNLESTLHVVNCDTVYYRVNIEVNEPDYGSATGAGNYLPNTIAQVEAFANNCYRFSHWTIEDEVVSYENQYSFTVTDNVTLVAHFYALDFDTYCPTLWDNTFMLNLLKLREEGYEVTGCLWYKNGIELKETNTINEFSYSAGPNEGNLLELSPTYYMFELLTSNFGALCSNKKIITGYNINKLIVYPNPVIAGTLLTVVGTEKESSVNVYNYYGACVGKIAGEEGLSKLTLDLPAGIYFIRTNNKTAKIIVVK